MRAPRWRRGKIVAEDGETMHQLSQGLARATVVVAAFFGSLTGSAHAAPQSVTAVADAFVRAVAPDSNFGGAGAVVVAPPALSNGEHQGLMRFDLAPVKSAFDAQFGAGNWSVTSASLRLTTTPASSGNFNANAAGPISVSWMQNDAWVEGTGTPGIPATDGITFNTLPSFLSPADEPMGTINFPGGNSGANTYALSLTGGFASDALSGGTTSLRLFAGNDTVSFLFNSRNFGTAGTRPVLIIDAIPEPAVGSVVGFFAIALLGRARATRSGCARGD